MGAIADYLLGSGLIAASEAIRLGERFGLEPDAILRMGEDIGRGNLRMMEDQVLTRRFQSGRSLGMIRGNVELASKLAATLQLVSPMLAATLAAWNEADAGLGSGADHTAIVRWLEGLQPPAEPAEELEPVGGPTRT
jgi:3-hydroxyisobutyrate dehydrogenase